MEPLEARMMLNSAPVATDDILLVPQDESVVLDVVLLNDSDADGDALSIEALSSFTSPANGSIVDNGGGSFSYIPDAGFVGVDRFRYRVDDNVDGFDTAWIDISVNQQIDPYHGNSPQAA